MNTRIVPGKIYICNYLNATNVMLYLGRCRVHYKSDICAYDMQGYFYYSLAILPDEELNRIAFEDCYFDEPLKADTMSLVCRRLKDREMFVLEQIKGSKPPILVKKMCSSNKLFNVKIGGERWNICCI
jgi:hypothetical protein